MLYTQSYHQDVPPVSVHPTISLPERIRYTVPVSRSPFVPARKLLQIKKKFLLGFAKLCHKLFQTELYCIDDKILLYQLTPETRALLSWLIQNQALQAWFFTQSVPGYPKTKILILEPEPIVDPNGRQYHLIGANGVGVGKTYQEAALPALGEFIERLASCGYWWEDTRIFRSVFRPNTTMINPEQFVHISKNNFDQTEAHRWIGNYDVYSNSLQWKRAKDLVTGRTVYVPAALCYMFSDQAMVNDPFFPEVSSNGVATHTNYYEACTRALLEFIERDVFLQAWYQKKVGYRISLDSLKESFADAERLLAGQNQYTRTYIINLANDLSVSTFVGVRIDEHSSGRPIFFTAAADLDHDTAVEKTLKELIRFANTTYSDNDASSSETVEKMQATANSMIGREKVWSHKSMLQHLEWFVSGEEISYKELVNLNIDTRSANLSYYQRYVTLKKLCQANNFRVYMVPMTNSVARQAGLTVIRALTPDLIPMFFGEQYIPLAHPRLVPNNYKAEDLNQIPHPFL